MRRSSPILLCRAVAFAVLVPLWASSLNGVAGSKATINSDLVLVVDAKKVFPIGFTMPPLVPAYQVIKETDPNHPVVIIHAPRGTVESMRKYNGTGDILGADIYPISYPPGEHSLLTNKNISLVGDHTRIMMEVAEVK